MPAGSKVVKAHLTWAASGNNNDYDVILNNNNISADSGRRYTYSFENGGNTLDFFSGAADVTNEVAAIVGNAASGGNYTFSFTNISYDGASSKFCDSGRAFAGWALIVIYELDTDPLRLVNVFEGFDMFWGSDLELQPKNFQVPAVLPNGVNLGKHAHITWEGDPQLNTERDGYTEDLKFENSTLSFGPGSVNPPGAQYNATIADETLPSSTYVTNSYGVDLDVYDISQDVKINATGVTTVYEAGQDRVFLSSEVLSILNVNVADIQVSEGPSPNPISLRGSEAVIRVQIDNDGPFDSNGELISTVTLDEDLTLSGPTTFNTNSWSCTQTSTVPTTLDCSKTTTFTNGSSDYFDLPVFVASDAKTTLSVDASIPGNVTAPYPVIGGEFDNVTSNNQTSFTYSVENGPITVNKTVSEDNDGVFEASDTITYTITLTADQNAAATGISIVDPIPANINNFTYDFSSLEPEVVNNSTATEINLSNISIAAGETVQIKFSATIDASVAMNTPITNTATVSYSDDYIYEPSASFIVTNFVPATTEKQLYLYSTDQNQPDGMSRKRTFTGNQKYVAVGEGSTSCISNPNASNCQIWTLRENLADDLVINGVELHLLLRDDGNDTGDSHFYLAIVDSDYNVLADKEVFTNFPAGGPKRFVYQLAGTGTLPKGSAIRLVIENREPLAKGRFRVKPSKGDVSTNNFEYSEIRINTPTVINVDSIKFYNAPYVDVDNSNGAVEITNVARENEDNEQTVYVRAIVSDPFGTFDITNISATLTDSLGETKVSYPTLTTIEIVENQVEKLMVEFSYTIQNTDELGAWQVNVIANEGDEGIIWHTLTTTFDVYTPPELTITKQVALASSPTTLITNAQPMDILQYQFEITNISEGDAVNLVVNENISPYSALCFITDTPATDTFECTNCADVAITTEDTEFSENNDSNFIYSPSPIAASSPNGRCNFIDNQVTNVQIKLNGTLEPTKSIIFTYQVVVN